MIGDSNPEHLDSIVEVLGVTIHISSSVSAGGEMNCDLRLLSVKTISAIFALLGF